MDFGGGMREASADVSENKSEKEFALSKETLEKFDQIMGDDQFDQLEPEPVEEIQRLNASERENKFNNLFNFGDFFKKQEVEVSENHLSEGEETNQGTNEETSEEGTDSEDDISDKREPNSEYRIGENVYETDDNGNTYKKNGKLLPNAEYTLKGYTYKTDKNGNITTCDAKPALTDDGTRNTKEQRESGGEERKEDDDGGHLIAKILGGAEGEENLVPMRRTINRGDYKKMENEIAKALLEGKKVSLHIDIEYDGDSQRPSKIRVEYTIDGKKTVVEFDNKENSTDLSETLENKIGDEDYNALKEEIEDRKADGIETSLTSVKTEYDENGKPVKITVGVLDESTGIKTYKVYEPKQED